MAIENNMVVAMEYELKEEGTDTVIDSNKGVSPLEFIMGKGAIIPGLEKEIGKMAKGDTGLVTVAPAEAYGEYDETGAVKTPIEQFAGIELKEGLVLYGQAENGQTVQVTVKEFDDKEVVIDYNHPLAGKTLCFDVKIADVREATEEELAQGYAGPAMGGCGCGTGGGGCGSEGHSHGDDHECCGAHEPGDEGCCGTHK
ncbi:MAG: peptidylprolyl isomerase [Campylobacterales bacterium]|nr:peptidylprolyl isomerase [Campylobacterales bacterium]